MNKTSAVNSPALFADKKRS